MNSGDEKGRIIGESLWSNVTGDRKNRVDWSDRMPKQWSGETGDDHPGHKGLSAWVTLKCNQDGWVVTMPEHTEKDWNMCTIYLPLEVAKWLHRRPGNNSQERTVGWHPAMNRELWSRVNARPYNHLQLKGHKRQWHLQVPRTGPRRTAVGSHPKSQLSLEHSSNS